MRPSAHFIIPRAVLALFACGALVACGSGRNSQVDPNSVPPEPVINPGSGVAGAEHNLSNAGFGYERSSIWDVFGSSSAEQTVQVNRYLWTASLDILSFLPVQSVDPFTGVIVTGYGTPPGGGRAYRATVHISDPALDARSLKVSLQSRGGAVNASTARAVEDAILTRARQLRSRDSKL